MAKVGKSLTHGIGDWFVATLQIAGPLLIVMFIADLTLGLMSRIAPAMNVFSLSFPFKILLTLLLLGFTFLLMPQVIANFTEDTLRVFKEVT
jgi:flagellar biosynthetic protein FliR